MNQFRPKSTNQAPKYEILILLWCYKLPALDKLGSDSSRGGGGAKSK